MSELQGRLAVIKVSGAAVAMTAEATTTTDNKVYQITNAAKRVLDRTAAITVKETGVVTAESYTVNRLNGTVTFVDVDVTRGAITIDGKYLPMSAAATAHSYTYNRACDLHDVTPFLATHRKRIPGLKYASGTLSAFTNADDITGVIDTYFEDALVASEPVVMEFRGQATGDPQRVWAMLEQTEMQAAISDPQKTVVTFISTDSLLNLV